MKDLTRRENANGTKWDYGEYLHLEGSLNDTLASQRLTCSIGWNQMHLATSLAAALLSTSSPAIATLSPSQNFSARTWSFSLVVPTIALPTVSPSQHVRDCRSTLHDR